jgi:hypothetical protein
MQSVKLYLDSGKRDKQLSTAFCYVWNIKLQGIDGDVDGVTVLNASEIKNICGLKTADIQIYNNGTSFIHDSNVELQIKEFITDAYQLGPQRYHFPMYCDDSLFCRVKNKGEYWFTQVFSQMPTTLSVTFFNGWSYTSYPTNAPLYIDQNFDNINCTADITINGNTGVLTNIISNTPNAPGHPCSGYNFWNVPFKLTTRYVNSIINTSTIITLNLTTDNPADAAALAIINAQTYKVKYASFNTAGHATAEIEINTSGLVGNIQPVTFTASCVYVWILPNTVNYNLIIQDIGSLVYIRNFLSNITQLNLLTYNNLVNRQSGWQYMPVENVGALVLLGLDPTLSLDPLSITAVGQFDALKIIIPLEIFYQV